MRVWHHVQMEPVPWTDVLLGATLEIGVRIVCFVLGGGLTVLGFWGLRRRVKVLEAGASSASGPTVNVNVGTTGQETPPPAPPIIDHAPQPERTPRQLQERPHILSKTPKELVDMVRGKTQLAASQILQDHVGSYLVVRGVVADISGDANDLNVMVRMDDGTLVAMWFSRGKWDGHISKMEIGDDIRASGKLHSATSNGVFVRECELNQ